jgi:hypothetical protein
MSEFVEIKSSPAEIMGIANGISDRGRALTSRIADLNDAIVVHDNENTVYPSDQFSDPFKATYKQSAVGADGKPTTADEAVRSSATYCGTKLTEIGDYVSGAMMNYGATDDESGADIRKTDV